MGITDVLTIFADNTIHTSDKDLSGNTIAAVVITGISVVFIALILLIALVWLYGKIFKAVNERAKTAKAAKTAEKTAENKTPEKAPALVKTAAPAAVTDGVEEEVVAVIMAAVAAYGAQTGRKLAVKSIKPTSGTAARRNAWSAAGLAEATRPF